MRVIRVILVCTVGAEALLVGGYGLTLAFGALTQPASEAGAAPLMALMAVGIAAGLGWAARGALAGRGGARAPIIVWQILQAAVAKEAVAAGSFWGWLLAVPVLVVVVTAFWPGVLQWRRPGEDGAA